MGSRRSAGAQAAVRPAQDARSSTEFADGRLPPGTRLPTVRELAGQLGMAVNTVARAYRELESAGILETRGRFGTFVARADPADAAMATAAHTYATAAKALGMDKAEALRYVEAAFG